MCVNMRTYILSRLDFIWRFQLCLYIWIVISLDNSTLENLLPGVIDASLELVLGSQGPGRPAPADNTHSKERDRDLLSKLPGQYQLLYDEVNNFMYT